MNWSTLPTNYPAFPQFGRDSDALLCPKCSDKYGFLHHVSVEVFNRKSEDSTSGISTQIWTDIQNPSHQSALRVEPDAETRNPSTRRNGIIITFRCENCSGVSEFLIAQHKGQTYMGWSEDMWGKK